jgi:hypothetical protein
MTDLSTLTDEELANRRNEIKLELAELARAEETLRAERDNIDAEFRNRFNARGSTATKTANWTTFLKVDDAYPELYDRQEFEEYILKTKDLHLLQSRISISAVQEELAAGVNIPGIRMIRKETVNQIKRS